jgi:hypothetical protein
MPRLPLALATSVLLAAPLSASADVLALYAEAHGAYMYGQGIAGDQQEDAFFARSRGPGYGARVGGRFLIFDGNVNHHQYLHDGELTTWTQFNAGLGFTVGTGSEADQKAHRGGYFELGASVGFGLGTGAQVDPPLDNTQITDKGFFLEGRIGVGKHLSSVFDIGVALPVSWGYVFKSGDGATANDVSSQYQSVQIQLLLVLRANLRFI